MSLQQSIDNLKTCKTCKQNLSSLSFRMHNRGGQRGTCRNCENAKFRACKGWLAPQKVRYAQRVRRERRAYCLVNDAKRRAVAKKSICTIDWRDIQRRIDLGACEVTGMLFDLNTPKSWNAPSLDQIVPGAGYTPENTRVVLYAVNTMANDWGLDLILSVADAIRAKRSVHAD